MKKLVLALEVVLGLIPFLPLLSDTIFKTNIHTSIMKMTLQWPLWLKMPIFLICVLLYLYFWYTIFKEIKNL
ncbi:hypothetical protein HMPREF0548_1404 [Lactobacillus ultunensis DSM 16047]|uniref:Ubiquitin n=1 Tax=Lactobacillus ultunensis DSM 16047 TaxID=525365 RepID=C2EP08_9LACO|nr:hypothetical protein HMPREF0548_1404 [Lactobacillus ultunensis DSM 16047]